MFHTLFWSVRFGYVYAGVVGFRLAMEWIEIGVLKLDMKTTIYKTYTPLRVRVVVQSALDHRDTSITGNHPVEVSKGVSTGVNDARNNLGETTFAAHTLKKRKLCGESQLHIAIDLPVSASST